MSDSVAAWTIACQAPLSLGFSRQEYWSGLPHPSPGDLPDLEIEHGSPALQADSLLSESYTLIYCKNRITGLHIVFCNLTLQECLFPLQSNMSLL